MTTPRAPFCPTVDAFTGHRQRAHPRRVEGGKSPGCAAWPQASLTSAQAKHARRLIDGGEKQQLFLHHLYRTKPDIPRMNRLWTELQFNI
jgi:hypothetical protein